MRKRFGDNSCLNSGKSGLGFSISYHKIIELGRSWRRNLIPVVFSVLIRLLKVHIIFFLGL